VLNYNEAVELARECARHARLAISTEAAAELWKMAEEYQAVAAKLDGGQMPDIGPPPLRLF
jgi:hypothetical protein